MTTVLIVAYIVGFVLFSGIMHGLYGWDEPWMVMAIVWPLVVPIMGVYFATRRIKRVAHVRAEMRIRARAEESRVLREAGLDL